MCPFELCQLVETVYSGKDKVATGNVEAGGRRAKSIVARKTFVITIIHHFIRFIG